MKTISKLRLEKGLTQDELADATGISLRTIQRIELGKVKPRAYSLKKIAEALKVDFSDLLPPNHHQMASLSNLFSNDRKKYFAEIFYTFWATVVFLLFLLNTSSQILGSRFLSSSILFSNDFHIMRLAITISCALALTQIYLLLLRRCLLSSYFYWILLALFSVLPMYLKYTSYFVIAPYSPLNNIQFYLSFICWLILLFFGVTYKSLFNIPSAEKKEQL